MPTESDLEVATAPEITTCGLYDILSKITPFAFDGLNVAINANFESFGEKVTFAQEFTVESQIATDAEPFLAVIRADEDLLAARLTKARDASHITGTNKQVSLDGIRMDPTWPVLILSAGPCIPTR